MNKKILTIGLVSAMMLSMIALVGHAGEIIIAPGDGWLCVKVYGEDNGESYRIGEATLWMHYIYGFGNTSKTHYWTEDDYCTLIYVSGTYNIWVTALGHKPSEIRRVEVIEGERVELDPFILQKSHERGWINGTVCGTTEEIDYIHYPVYDDETTDIDWGIPDEAKFPIMNAKVTVISRYDNSEVATTFTDENGEYNVSVEAGVYSVIARRPGETRGPGREARVEENKSTKIDILIRISENRKKVEESIIQGSFGGEITVQKEENKALYDHEIMIYDGVVIEPVTISQGRISIIVSGDENSSGRTIAINVDQYVFDTNGDIVVEYDGETIRMADDINDVLNPNDDGSHPEYLIAQGTKGTQILISIPHFSEHEITVYSLAEAIGGITAVILYIIVIAIIAIVYILPIRFVQKK